MGIDALDGFLANFFFRAEADEVVLSFAFLAFESLNEALVFLAKSVNKFFQPEHVVFVFLPVHIFQLLFINILVNFLTSANII